MNDNSVTKNSDIATTLVSSIFAAGIVTVLLLVGKVLWPLFRFILKKVWSTLMKVVKRKSTKDAAAPEPELPTPDIFKGAQNLARAKSLEF
ncbi:hypothetical protein [Herbaspirillum sp. VT-16-41]|uniref:hypothetical protein n=1 Tax=Herbaspirillum sp. VT-16-41 TaxID=1953765 RepID=UPI0009815157|nr:hypothetical protein [Herbaspirillum sp. VT-16-41]ONN63813.1 hypothetical protein BTM36_25600 [Herbaspirillum sp. VT-16-41]